MTKRRPSATLDTEQTAMATGLIRRSGRYSTRRVIPLDLQAHYGRREIVRALGTASPDEARKLHARMWVTLDQEFDRARRDGASKPPAVAPRSAPAVAVTEAEAAYQREKDALEGAEETRAEG